MSSKRPAWTCPQSATILSSALSRHATRGLVEVQGKLVRACATTVEQEMNVRTDSARAGAAQREAFDRLLANHMLYCTVCDNNNGNCTVHNTTKMLQVEHQKIPFQPKHTKSTNRDRSTGTIRASACSARGASRRARTSR